MNIFDNISKAVAGAGNKTKDISETVRLNSLITQNGNAIRGLYTKIGENYVKMYKENPDQALAEFVGQIISLENQNIEYRKKIEQLKGIKICKACGAENSNGSLFCNICGAKFEEEQPANIGAGRCSNCGAALTEGMKFCTSCGTPVPVSEPVHENPVYEKPAYEEPAYEEPAYEEPAYEEPAYEEPAYEEPVYEAPSDETTYSELLPEENDIKEESLSDNISVDDIVIEEPVLDDIEIGNIAIEEPEIKAGSTIKCPYCGEVLSSDMRFCTSCGTKLESVEEKVVEPVRQSFCTNCGSKIEPDALFCENCGHKID